MNEQGDPMYYRGVRIREVEGLQKECFDHILYSDLGPRYRPSLRVRFLTLRDRAKDAWLVLTGRAEIEW